MGRPRRREAGGVRFSRFGVTFDRNDASTAVTLSARTPPSDSPANALAALRVRKRYVRTGDVESATLRFSLGADALPADASLSDVALYQRRTDEWRRLATSRDGRNFSATVYDLSTVVVGVERRGADSSASGAGNASSGERREDDRGTDDRDRGADPAARDERRQERRPAGLRISRRARRVDSSRP